MGNSCSTNDNYDYYIGDCWNIELKDGELQHVLKDEFVKEMEICGKRNRIAEIARKYDNYEKWAEEKPKDNFPAGYPKCNKFVYDVLSEADACPLSKSDASGTWPIRVVDWVKGDYTKDGWKNMGPGATWEKGDVIAKKIDHFTNASGHCGIAVSKSEAVAAGTNEVSRGDHGLSDATVIRYFGKD